MLVKGMKEIVTTNYNPDDKNSIYEYAKKLEGKTFRDVNDEYDYNHAVGIKDAAINYGADYENRKRKGGLGDIIEKKYFHMEISNAAAPDFPGAGVELKVTPYKLNKNQSISAKERLIISMINYINVIQMDFYTSNVWEKLRNVLLIYYLWDSDTKSRLDYLIKYVYMFTPNKQDLKIIEHDFNIIKSKVMDGKAHELSEGDTLYLGAATKAATSTDRVQQPCSDVLAKPRAFSLKNSYMTYVLRDYILGQRPESDRIIEDEMDTTFEQYVLEKLGNYYGLPATDLFFKFFGQQDIAGKHKYSRLVFKMLGVKTKNAEEFEKANIVVKTIRAEDNNKIIESISFPYFTIADLVNQEWEESDIYNYFNETKFLFVVYKKEKEEYYLHGSKFWNMPSSDLDGDLKKEWLKAQRIFKEGVKFIINDSSSTIKNNLPKKSNTRILHVRPHAKKSAYLIDGKKYKNGSIETDTDILPDGNRMTKQCFWLNNDYVKKIVEDLLNNV